jgi:hypothetical protein
VPPPRPEPAVGSLLRSAAADRIQRAIGFELELQVLLTSGMPLQAPKANEFPVTLEDLEEGKVAPRPQVLQTVHTVVLKDGSTFQWMKDSKDEEKKGTVIRPKNLETDSGRWVLYEVSNEKHRFFDPLLKKEDKVHKGDLLEAVEDHAGGPIHPDRGLSSIVELVTAPRDEFGDEKEFLKPIMAAQTAAADIVKQTSGLSKRIPAASVFPDARGDLYLGFDLDELADAKSSAQMAAAAVQATYAVRLEALPRWLETLAKGPPRTMKDEVRILIAAPESARRVVEGLLHEGLLKEFDPGLYGLLTVLAMYLEGGKSETLGDNPKNYAPLLNRAGIDTFVKQASFFGEEAGRLLADQGGRKQLIALLLDQTKRSAGDNVLVQFNKSPIVGDWLEQVLSGSGDAMRDFSRFGRAKRIPHEDVGPEKERAKAPVFEERQVPGGLFKLRPELIPYERWDRVALEYREQLRTANTPPSSSLAEKSIKLQEEEVKKDDLPDLSGNVNQAKSSTNVSNVKASSSSVEPPKKGDKVVVINKKTGERILGVYIAFAASSSQHAVEVTEIVDKVEKKVKRPYRAADFDVLSSTD